MYDSTVATACDNPHQDQRQFRAQIFSKFISARGFERKDGDER